MHTHMVRLRQVNGDSMDLHSIGMASEGLPKDNGLLLGITHTVCQKLETDFQRMMLSLP